MRGYSTTPDFGGAETQEAPECQAADAVGNFIEFWGFKRNHGRIWALLYLRAQALTAAELQEQLGLSKGGVSMMTRELERWGVIHRRRQPGAGGWRFTAETDFMAMVGRVMREREALVVSRVRKDLAEAQARARAAGLLPELLDRMGRMVALATLAEGAIDLFLRTAQIDVTSAVEILKQPLRMTSKKISRMTSKKISRTGAAKKKDNK